MGNGVGSYPAGRFGVKAVDDLISVIRSSRTLNLRSRGGDTVSATVQILPTRGLAHNRDIPSRPTPLNPIGNQGKHSDGRQGRPRVPVSRPTTGSPTLTIRYAAFTRLAADRQNQYVYDLRRRKLI